MTPFWIGFLVGAAAGIASYWAFARFNISSALKAFEARLVAIEKAIAGKS